MIRPIVDTIQNDDSSHCNKTKTQQNYTSIDMKLYRDLLFMGLMFYWFYLKITVCLSSAEICCGLSVKFPLLSEFRCSF